MKSSSFVCLVLLATAAASSGAERHLIRVHDAARAAGLVAAGATLVADYGSFQVLEAAGGFAPLAAMPADERIDEQYRIELNAGAIDTRDAVAPRRLAAVGAGQELRLVQFAGPVKPEWLAGLTNGGAHIVTYIPHNAYLVYAPPAAVAALQARKQADPLMRFEGAYLPDDKIQPRARLFDADGNPRVLPTDLFAIQMVDDAAANAATMALVDAVRLAPAVRQERRGGYFNVIVRLPPEQVQAVAAQPDVVSINLYSPRRKFDERQDQIVAGNLAGSQPSGPGYLAWLASVGFTQSQFTASGFVVDVCDSGVDNGTTTPNHFALFAGGDTSQASRVVYNRLEGTANSGSTLQGCDGHGNINAHIIGGWVGMTNFPHTDSAGYRYGLGVCPFVKVGSSVIFDPSNFTTPDYDDMISRAYRDGARISSDSWGAATSGDYDVDAQNYDELVRDAQPSGAAVATAGNQEMTIVFAAGNDGPSTQTVGSPGTAKNVITVGAAENVHSHASTNGGADASGNDGCTTPDSEANGAGDIASFSSRGPCADLRKKPEICAPGTHVTGGAAQQTRTMAGTGNDLPCFSGEGVCGLPGGGTAGSAYNFFPLGQQFYTTSSGTSHSTPAVAGGCALVRQYFLNQGRNAPSPAMVKAYLVNAARYMTGTYANDALFSNNQGFGGMNLGTAFNGAPRVLRDQLTNDLFTATGQTRVFPVTIGDTGKPVRVTLAWTDAPGATSGNAYKNNLDLTVTAGGITYKGNVFSGATSAAGGSADVRNNTECVFLGAGRTGIVVVTVTAANINSDGVPNYGTSVDQDFALVVHNATAGASNQPPVLNPVGDRTAQMTNFFSFAVSAIDLADGDTVTLRATNLPAWAVFDAVTNAGGVTNVFAGTPPETGVFPVTFLASDKDGTVSETILINVLAGGMPTNLIDEHFDAGTTPPAGWTFTGIASTYTSVSSYGRRSPSLKLDDSGDVVETVSFANGTNLSFWIKGQGTDASSALLVQGLSGASWGTIANLAPLPVTGTTNVLPLGASITKLRFTYTKSAGNLAFDDVIVNGLSSGGAPGGTPPAFQAVPAQYVAASNTLQFSVSATPSDGDIVTLAMSNAPAGAAFASTNEFGTFIWPAAATAGVYSATFHAWDKDGAVATTVTINVTGGGGSGEGPTNLLVYFDFDTAAGAFESVADYVAAGVTAAPVTIGAGVLTNYSGNPTRAAGGTGWAPTNYFAFVVSVATGWQMNVNVVAFDDRASGTGPSEWRLRHSGDGYGADLAAGNTHADFTTNTCNVSLTDIAGQVTIRIAGSGASAASGTWRIDNVRIAGSVGPIGGLTNIPPVLHSLTNLHVLWSNAVQFTVSATPTDGDVVTLTVSNAPGGSTFAATNEAGTFTWLAAGPPGVYTPAFYAADKDGVVTSVVTITVTNTLVPPSGCISTNLLAENFDAATTVPAGWGGTNTANDAVSSHYASAPNCRGLPLNSALITPPVNGPTQLTFYADASSGGNGKTGTVDYAINGGAWTPLASFVATTGGAFVLRGLAATPDLSGHTNVQFRFASSFNTWYLDDVRVDGVICGGPPGGFVDANGNGIDDAWELAHFGSLTNATSESDYDGDGFLDLHEYLAGTQPTNPASLLVATAVTNSPGAGTIIVWQSASNRAYAIERAADAAAAFAAIATNLPAVPPLNVYTDSVTTNASGVYRIRLQ